MGGGFGMDNSGDSRDSGFSVAVDSGSWAAFPSKKQVGDNLLSQRKLRMF